MIMMKRFKFLSNERGAIAVETAIAMPILIFAFLTAVDIGLKVTTMQNMTKATRSGTEYVVKGGRNDAIVRQIMSDSYGKQLQDKDVQIVAYCGCVTENEAPEGEVDQDGTKYGGTYTKTKTVFGENMCVATCDSGSEISTLVNIRFGETYRGVLKSKNLSTEIQTRVQ